MTPKLALFALALSAAALVGGCSGNTPSSDAGAVDAGPVDAGITVRITTTVESTRFDVREHMLAAGEMQISGEPFAESMQRILSNYSRDVLPTDIYRDSSPLSSGPWIDLAGFSTGVESYEYSKQPMNGLGLEFGAGTSLQDGPLVSPDGGTGADATARLAARMQTYARESHALGRFVFPAGTFPANNPSGDLNPTGAGTGAENPLGWPGIWPTVHVFASFDPTVNPTGEIALACAITSDDDPGASGALSCADYECDASTLHLASRASQVDPTVTPGADGFSSWKYGLWVLNYLQVMHDAVEAPVSSVSAADLSNVGSLGNQIVGADDADMDTLPGTYLGSSDIEGFQAAMFIDEIDNRFQDWLTRLTTADGAALSGFGSIQEALAYDEAQPLRWFPAQISVAETSDGTGFPVPAYALESADSDLLDQTGLVLGASEFLALTDTANADVGGAQTAQVYFDGDPFPADNQHADGEPTLHDRALAMMRVALVNIDRLHTDPATGYLVDSVAMSGATPTRGTTASTVDVAYALLGMRTALRALGSTLELYSNNTPDSALGTTALDPLPLRYPGDEALTFSRRVKAMIGSEADLLYSHLTDSSGRAYAGWDVAAGAPSSADDTLDAHTAAVRGLFAAYLATGDVRYHDRAMAVFNRMEQVFYDPTARIYSATPAPVDSVVYTPLRFALLQSTLRDVYELVASRPGNEAMAFDLEDRVGRLNKLVLNGWDDRNQDRIVNWPDECTHASALPDGGTLPHGGLQMAERTLTGEIGSFQEQMIPGVPRTPTVDRDQDCVPEVDDAHLPAALANQVTFHIERSAP